MQDRFKFRVYITENDAYPEKVGYVNTEDFYIHPDGEESYFNADYDFAESVIEQCTGLKDKNGKLIYEGDICRVKGSYYDCDYHEYFEVDDVEIIESLEKFFGEAMVKGVYSALGCDSLQVEVVGNIHENADLLGDKTDD